MFENRTYGFNVINESGKVLQEIDLPKDKMDDLLQLSPTGERAAFVNVAVCPASNEKSTLDYNIKVLNISSGNTKEIGKINDLIDNYKEESLYKVETLDENNNTINQKLPGSAFGRLEWDKSGSSLFYNYKYTSKEDGNNHTDIYVVTFD